MEIVWMVHGRGLEPHKKTHEGYEGTIPESSKRGSIEPETPTYSNLHPLDRCKKPWPMAHPWLVLSMDSYGNINGNENMGISIADWWGPTYPS